MARLIGLLLWILTLPLPAAEQTVPQDQQPPQLELAQRYINAITSLDFRQVQRMLHRETEYEDVMAGTDLTGGRDILKFLRRVHLYTKDYQFVIDHQFYHDDKVVMIGNYYYRAKGNLFGLPNELITVTLPGITVLDVDVKKQRIDRHEDTLDYDTLKAQLKLYRYEPLSYNGNQ
ncbi:nuclear transport factor 2 family protein [Ferrimonas senticii]|uniref:nuclear transport factor 2 family protein n=1 Tax=Ferrimonas senticii TaxID=394566 RepID=UPI00040E6C17|nr:nuclear transport factor 2 family protein [Ferrimonas senticii]